MARSASWKRPPVEGAERGLGPLDQAFPVGGGGDVGRLADLGGHVGRAGCVDPTGRPARHRRCRRSRRCSCRRSLAARLVARLLRPLPGTGAVSSHSLPAPSARTQRSSRFGGGGVFWRRLRSSMEYVLRCPALGLTLGGHLAGAAPGDVPPLLGALRAAVRRRPRSCAAAPWCVARLRRPAGSRHGRFGPDGATPRRVGGWRPGWCRSRPGRRPSAARAARGPSVAPGRRSCPRAPGRRAAVRRPLLSPGGPSRRATDPSVHSRRPPPTTPAVRPCARSGSRIRCGPSPPGRPAPERPLVRVPPPAPPPPSGRTRSPPMGAARSCRDGPCRRRRPPDGPTRPRTGRRTPSRAPTRARRGLRCPSEGIERV